MNVAREARGRARQVYRASGFLATTAAMLPLYLSHHRRVPEAEKDLVRDLWVRRWARALLGLFAIDVVVRGSVPPPTRKGAPGRLIVTNHRSAIDIGVILATFGGTMVSRADSRPGPVVGAAARSVGTVFVDRASAKSGAATIRAIQKQPRGRPDDRDLPRGDDVRGRRGPPVPRRRVHRRGACRGGGPPGRPRLPRELRRCLPRRDVPRPSRSNGAEHRDPHGRRRRPAHSREGDARRRAHGASPCRGEPPRPRGASPLGSVGSRSTGECAGSSRSDRQ